MCDLPAGLVFFGSCSLCLFQNLVRVTQGRQVCHCMRRECGRTVNLLAEQPACLGERNGFEPAVPFLNFLTTTLGDGLITAGCRPAVPQSEPRVRIHSAPPHSL